MTDNHQGTVGKSSPLEKSSVLLARHLSLSSPWDTELFTLAASFLECPLLGMLQYVGKTNVNLLMLGE